MVRSRSFLLEQGESTGQLAAKFPGAQLGTALDTVPFPLADGGTGNDLYIKQDEFQRVFAADVPEDVTSLMAATQRPITSAALEQPAEKAAWKTIPSWNMITIQDLAIPAESMRFMGERATSHNVEINASHAVTVSQPDAVADLIDWPNSFERGRPHSTVEPAHHGPLSLWLTSGAEWAWRRGVAPPGSVPRQSACTRESWTAPSAQSPRHQRSHVMKTPAAARPATLLPAVSSSSARSAPSQASTARPWRTVSTYRASDPGSSPSRRSCPSST
jgi:hypothetical protein